MAKNEQQEEILSEEYSGEIRYAMTNDYMFRAVMQKNTEYEK